MSFTNTVIELTANEPLQATDIASKTALSIGYVRTQLRLMELSGVIERVDNRTPIFYRPSANSSVAMRMAETARIQEAVDNAKRALQTPLTEDENSLLKMIKKTPKGNWPDLISPFEILAEAIKQLDSEGKLVDTL